MFCRCLTVWMEGAINYESKWSKNQIRQIDVLLKSFNTNKPKEIHRSVRGVTDIEFWKGTEFRAFLLYFGIIILKEHLSQEEYKMFLKLTIAVRICYTDAYKSLREVARIYFRNYIEECINMYGIHSIGSNIHNLSHVVDDVDRFGSLSDISTYPFENRLQFLKSRSKQPNLPLQQITRRIVELSIDFDELYSGPEKQVYPQLRSSSKIDENVVYGEIIVNFDWKLSTTRDADSWFLTIDNDIVKMKHAVSSNNEIIVYGLPISNKGNFFTQPVSSMKLDIFASDGCTDPLRAFKFESIKSKMICFPINTGFVYIPLLHTM